MTSRRIVARRSERDDQPRVPTSDVAFLIGLPSMSLNAPWSSVRFGPNPQGSILPPSDRGRRLGRRLRSFFVSPTIGSARRAVRARWRDPRRRSSDSAVQARCVRIAGDGTHLVRADLRPPSRAGRRRRRRSLPVGRRADRARDHRRHRHLQPPRRPPAAARPRASRRATGTTLLPSSLDDAFVLDGPGEYEVHDVLVTGVRTYRDDAQGRRARQAGRLRRRARRRCTRSTSATSATCCPRRSSATSARSTSPASRSAARSSPTSRRPSSIAQLDPKIVVPMPLCDDDGRLRRGAARFFHEMGAEPTTQPKLSVTISEPAGRDDDRPARVARQGLTARRPGDAGARAQPRSRTTRPRLTTVRTRSAAGQYGIWRRGRHAPDHEVGLLAGLERADLVVEPERLGRVDRDRRERPRRASARARGRRRSSPAAGSPSATCPG